MGLVKEMVNVKVQYAILSIFTLFGQKDEISRSWTDRFTYTCDICGNSSSFERDVYIGVYTGKMQLELRMKGFLELEWGHKKKELIVCDTHSEREIDKKIEELKDREAQPGECA